MSAHDCMGCGTEEPCQYPPDPLLEDVQRALRKVKIELLALRRRDAEKDATIAQLRQALSAEEVEGEARVQAERAHFAEYRARLRKVCEAGTAYPSLQPLELATWRMQELAELRQDREYLQKQLRGFQESARSEVQHGQA